MSQYFTQTVVASAGGITYSHPFVVDLRTSPVNIGFDVELVGGTSAQYTVQHTFTDPFSVNLAVATNGVWLNHEFLVSSNVSDDGNYAFPVRAIRLALSSAASASATFNIVEAGPR